MRSPEALAACAHSENLVRRERKFGPLVVREPEGDVVREAVILEQKLEAIAPRRAVDEVRAAPAEHVIRTLGKHGLVAHRFHGARQIVVVDQFRIAEDTGRYAEERFDPLVVQGDLVPGTPPGNTETPANGCTSRKAAPRIRWPPVPGSSG